MKTMKYFATVKILFHFISYFFEYEHFKLELLFCRTPGIKKVFLKVLLNLQNNTCVGVFFNKVPGLMPATLLKKRLRHMCFRMNFAKFLGTPFL